MQTKFGLYWNGRTFSNKGFNENLWKFGHLGSHSSNLKKGPPKIILYCLCRHEEGMLTNLVFIEMGTPFQIMVLMTICESLYSSKLKKGPSEILLYILCRHEDGILTKFGLYWNGWTFSNNRFNENLW